MERKPLKNGGWVDLRSKEEVTQRGRRTIQAISLGIKDILMKLTPEEAATTPLGELDLTEDQADAMIRLQEASIAALIAGWSRPEPVSLSAVADLPIDWFDELAVLCAGISGEIALDTSPGDVESPPDPPVPSGDSATLAGS